MIIGGKNFDTANHTYIMGILNVHMHTRWLKKV